MAEGLAHLRSGQLPKAVASLRSGIENWNGLGGHIRIPYVKSALAEALALQGNLDAALRLIDECLEQIERPGWQERSHLAEVLRLKGWMLMRAGGVKKPRRRCAPPSTGPVSSRPILGVARLNHPGGAPGRARTADCRARGAGADLRLVHRRFRDARSPESPPAPGYTELTPLRASSPRMIAPTQGAYHLERRTTTAFASLM